MKKKEIKNTTKMNKGDSDSDRKRIEKKRIEQK